MLTLRHLLHTMHANHVANNKGEYWPEEDYHSVEETLPFFEKVTTIRRKKKEWVRVLEGKESDLLSLEEFFTEEVRRV